MIVSSYSFIDASTGDYQEEEVFYQEEEEENFDHLTNQGKLTLSHRSQVQSSDGARHHYTYFSVQGSNPQFYSYKLLLELLKLPFIVNFGLSME